MLGKDGQTAVAVRGNFTASNGDALVAAAVLGQGLIYQPSFLVRKDVEAGRLTLIELEVPMLGLPGVFAVYPANRRPPAKVRALIDFLAERFEGRHPGTADSRSADKDARAVPPAALARDIGFQRSCVVTSSP